MAKKRRIPKARIELSEAEENWLYETGDATAAYLLSDEHKRALWEAHGAAVVEEFVQEHPGERPAHWWTYSAPRAQPGSYAARHFDPTVAEPRRRLGGIGTPKHEVLNHQPYFDCGVPVVFCTQFDADYYNGRAVDARGEPAIGTLNYRDGDFLGVPIDPDDPPTYESEAAYLKRRALFLQGEERRLPADAFDPEVVEP